MWLRVRGLRFVIPAYNAWLRLETRNPVTFNQKVRSKMARDRRPILTSFADKLDAKSYISNVVGPQYVPEVLAVASHAVELPWSELPQEMVVKTNHGSGACVVIWNGAEASSRVPELTVRNAWGTARVQPAVADPRAMAAFLDMNLSSISPGCAGSGLTGRAYRDVRPRVFAEELLIGADGSVPLDYKFYVFNGICEMVLVVFEAEMSLALANYFLPDWTHLEEMRGRRSVNPVVPVRPAELPEMLRIANRLGQDTDFVRVDFLLSEGRILIGELTNYPNGGRITFSPRFDHWLGGLWGQPGSYRDLPGGSYPREQL